MWKIIFREFLQIVTEVTCHKLSAICKNSFKKKIKNSRADYIFLRLLFKFSPRNYQAKLIGVKVVWTLKRLPLFNKLDYDRQWPHPTSTRTPFMCRTHSRNRTQHFLVNPVKVLQNLKTGNLKSLAENHFSGRIPYPQIAQLFLSFSIQLEIKFFKRLADNHLGSWKYWITLVGFYFYFYRTEACNRNLLCFSNRNRARTRTQKTFLDCSHTRPNTLCFFKSHQHPALPHPRTENRALTWGYDRVW